MTCAITLFEEFYREIEQLCIIRIAPQSKPIRVKGSFAIHLFKGVAEIKRVITEHHGQTAIFRKTVSQNHRIEHFLIVFYIKLYLASVTLSK